MCVIFVIYLLLGGRYWYSFKFNGMVCIWWFEYKWGLFGFLMLVILYIDRVK